MTGDPEKYEGNCGSGVPCSRCAHSRCPAHRYVASSSNAVSARTSRSDRAVWTARTASSHQLTETRGFTVRPCRRAVPVKLGNTGAVGDSADSWVAGPWSIDVPACGQGVPGGGGSRIVSSRYVLDASLKQRPAGGY